MPSGYTTALPTNISLGVGIVYYNSTSVVGVSDGGIRVTVDKDLENLPFDNKASPVEGLDYVWGSECVIAGEFIEIKDALWTADLIEPGLTATGTAGTPATVTYVPMNNRTPVSSGDYIPNLIYEMTLGSGARKRYVLPKAYPVQYEILSETRRAARVRVEWRSRLASSDAATSTDTPSYKIEIVPAA